MILKMYAVYDNGVKAYLPPFFMRAAGEASRAFDQACRDPNHNFFRHAADYTLFEIGEFDDNTGIVLSYPVHQSLGNGAHFKQGVVEQMKGDS